MGAAFSSDDSEHTQLPALTKDFYARHLSSKPEFGEEYTRCQDYFIRRALAATRANLVHLQPKVHWGLAGCCRGTLLTPLCTQQALSSSPYDYAAPPPMRMAACT